MIRGLTAGFAFAAGDVDISINFCAAEGFFESGHGDNGQTGGIPVKGHESAQGLKPDGIGEAADEFSAAIFGDDGGCDDPTEADHPGKEPRWTMVVIKSERSDAGAHGFSGPASSIILIVRLSARALNQVLAESQT